MPTQRASHSEAKRSTARASAVLGIHLFSSHFKKSLKSEPSFVSSSAPKPQLPDAVLSLLAKALKPPPNFKAASFYRLVSQFSNIDGGYILKNINSVINIPL